MPAEILVPGRNCRTIARADRLAVIIDGGPYFAALASVLERARRSVVMIGWDFDLRIRLRRAGAQGGPRADETLGDLLARLVAARPGLRVRMLNWTYGMAFGAVRWQVPTPLVAPTLPEGIDLRLDMTHPIGGAQHQKLVIIDDALAFCGGLDLTAGRWDSRDHADGDGRRHDSGTGAYGPYHDYAVAVTGAAARVLADVAAERWRIATGEDPPPAPPPSDSLWPEGLEPLLRHVPVGVARTLPPRDGRPGVREIEALVCDAIRAAKRTLYIESQYLSAQHPCRLMAERLAEPDGPEIVLISLPRAASSLEEITLGTARDHIEGWLRASDRFGRLRLLHPVTAEGRLITAHGKLLVADDRLLRIGSANLANRSMGLDSECDVALDAGGQPQAVRQAILDVRDAAIAEHLGLPVDRLRAEIAARQSLVAALDALRDKPGRTLRLLPHEDPPLLGALATRHRLFDPGRPRGPGDILGALGKVLGEYARRRPWTAAALGAGVAGAAAAALVWRRRRR